MKYFPFYMKYVEDMNEKNGWKRFKWVFITNGVKYPTIETAIEATGVGREYVGDFLKVYNLLNGASVNFADDTGSEWGLGREKEKKARNLARWLLSEDEDFAVVLKSCEANQLSSLGVVLG